MKNLENAHLKALKALKDAKKHSQSVPNDVVEDIKETHRRFLKEHSEEDTMKKEQKMERNKENNSDSESMKKDGRYWEDLSLFGKIAALVTAIILILLARQWDHLCYVLIWLGFLLYGKRTNIFYAGVNSENSQNTHWKHVIVGYIVFFLCCILLWLTWNTITSLFEKRTSEIPINNEVSSVVTSSPKEESRFSDTNKGNTEISEISFKSYYNSRFNYEIRYPSFFDKIEYPSNGDGCQLMRDEQTYLSVSGINNVLDKTLEEEYNKCKINSVYSRMKDDWFVVSGYTDDGRIYYKKTVLRNGAFLTAILYHPIEEKEYFSSIIPKIFTDFPNVSKK